MIKNRIGSRLRRSFIGILGLGAIVMAGCSAPAETGNGAAPTPSDSQQSNAFEGKKVGFLLPEDVTARWENVDRPFFEESLAKYAPGAEVLFYNAQNDSSTQQAQAEQALTQGVDVLVIIAIDQEAAGVIVENAAAEGVPVIAYDRLIRNSPVAYYVSVDGVAIGELQGNWLVANTAAGDNIAVINGSESDDNARLFRDGYMSVLQPLFDSGDRNLVYESWTPGWDPSAAQQQMEQALTQNANDIQAVLSANDGMAATIIAALEAQGMAGTVPVTGLDGTTQGLNLILQGKQGMSAYRSLQEQADKTAAIVAALLAGEEPESSLFSGLTVNNGQVDIPWATVTPLVIETDNVSLVMNELGLTPADVCDNVDTGIGVC